MDLYSPKRTPLADWWNRLNAVPPEGEWITVPHKNTSGLYVNQGGRPGLLTRSGFTPLYNGSDRDLRDELMRGWHYPDTNPLSLTRVGEEHTVEVTFAAPRFKDLQAGEYRLTYRVNTLSGDRWTPGPWGPDPLNQGGQAEEQSPHVGWVHTDIPVRLREFRVRFGAATPAPAARYAKVLLHLTAPGADPARLERFHDPTGPQFQTLMKSVLREISDRHQERRKATARAELEPLRALLPEVISPAGWYASIDGRADTLDALQAHIARRYRLRANVAQDVLNDLARLRPSDRRRLRREDDQAAEQRALHAEERRRSAVDAVREAGAATQQEEEALHASIRTRNEAFLSSAEHGEDELGPYVRFQAGAQTVTLSQEEVDRRAAPHTYVVQAALYRFASFGFRKFDSLYCKPLRKAAGKAAGLPEHQMDVLALNGDPFDFRPANLRVQPLSEAERPKLPTRGRTSTRRSGPPPKES